MKRLLLAILLLGAAFRADALDYTGLWYNPSQPGYGFNLAQSDNYIFVTFYVYGPNNTPSWYVAGVTWNGVDSYTGDVYYATSGTFFGAPWNPADYSPGKVGTATFKPSATNNYQATLSYVVNGVGGATTPIERQTLRAIALGGSYTGAQAGAYTGCTDTTQNYTYTDHYDLTVDHSADGTVVFTFAYLSNLTCTLSGTLDIHGQYYDMQNASYTCSDGLATTATMSEIKATSLGIEGRFYSASVGGGCAENATFSAVFVQ